jgi:DNA-binding NtrC family response regulator
MLSPMDTQEVSARITRVLLIDPDEAFGSALKGALGDGYSFQQVAAAKDAIRILEEDSVDVVLLNWDQPPRPAGTARAHEAIETISSLALTPPVIAFSWDDKRQTAQEAIHQGVIDFFPQPLSVLELRFAIGRASRRIDLLRELEAARRLIGARYVDGLLGASKPMEKICEVIHKVAAVQTTVLITGESGTGKEVVARSIHRMGARANKPFVAFSACALPESLIEDELFGHEKGSFTGAGQFRRGRFEEAQGGTIFIDEIGDLALPLQSKLLRILQERTFERLGSNVPIPLDVRVVCATNQNLEQMIKEGKFRQDLYFRISVVKVHLPPLRERMEDIPLLAEHFLKNFAALHNKDIHGFKLGYLPALAGHDWPGNVRELQNVVERSVVLGEGDRLGVDDLPPELQRLAPAVPPLVPGPFQESVQSFKRELVRSALRLHGGNRLKAAKELQISRCYLHRLLNQLNIEEEAVPGEEQGVEVEDEALEAAEPAASRLQ